MARDACLFLSMLLLKKARRSPSNRGPPSQAEQRCGTPGCTRKLVLRSPVRGTCTGRVFPCCHRSRMDRTDLRILAILQEDASLPVAEVAARVNLSQTPCWRRIQRLERNGVIERRVALVNPEAVGLGLSVFVEIEAGGHSPEWLAGFSEAVAALPEVMEVYRMAGDVDYLLRVVVGSMAEYDDFYRRLIAEVPLKNVTSRFAMERVKYTTAYPLPAPG